MTTELVLIVAIAAILILAVIGVWPVRSNR